MDTLILSNHALKQANRRNFSLDDIFFILKNGYAQRNTGAVFFQMRDKNIPKKLPGNDRRRNLAGTTILTCKCKRFVITMYKNPNAFKKDSKKTKYGRRDHVPESCPCCGDRYLH